MSGEPARIRILAADDHPIFRRGIAGLVSDQPDMTLVAEASNGRDAVQQFRAHRPDITLMDLQMPEMNGIDAIIAILANSGRASSRLTTYAATRSCAPLKPQGAFAEESPCTGRC